MPTNLMRVLRTLRSESLDFVGGQINYSKAALFGAECHPHTAGKNLRKALERYHGVPGGWNLLASAVTGSALADQLLKSLTERKP
jgi:hypothetical protein